ncbi:hypothetical protein AB5I41_09500 [Sphingomonas sp. MMS24-JH45]
MSKPADASEPLSDPAALRALNGAATGRGPAAAVRMPDTASLAQLTLDAQVQWVRSAALIALGDEAGSRAALLRADVVDASLLTERIDPTLVLWLGAQIQRQRARLEARVRDFPAALAAYDTRQSTRCAAPHSAPRERDASPRSRRRCWSARLSWTRAARASRRAPITARLSMHWNGEPAGRQCPADRTRPLPRPACRRGRERGGRTRRSVRSGRCRRWASSRWRGRCDSCRRSWPSIPRSAAGCAIAPTSNARSHGYDTRSRAPMARPAIWKRSATRPS